MADVSNRRREPKGIPTGGRFADEMGGAADASDLDQASDPFEENGLEGLPGDAKTMARIMAARGGDQVYRDLAKYNEAIGWSGSDNGMAKPGPQPAAPAMFDRVPLSAEAFSTFVANGMRDFRGADLHGLDLTGYDLKGLNLDGVDLTDARLDKADLTEASLRGARLDGASMRKVKTAGAVFDGASMRKADLSDTEFGDEEAEGAGVSFRGADMEGAVLNNASFYQNTDLTDVSLRNSTSNGEYGGYFVPDHTEGLDLRGAHWDGIQLLIDSGADFSGGHFTNMTCFAAGGVVSDADLRGSDVSDTACTGCDMRKAHVSGQVRLNGCDLRDATFRSFVRSVDLRGCRFEGARYGNDIKGRTGVRTDLDPDGVKPFDPEALGIRRW